MPKYTIDNPVGGKPIVINADGPLSDQEIDEIVSNQTKSFSERNPSPIRRASQNLPAILQAEELIGGRFINPETGEFQDEEALKEVQLVRAKERGENASKEIERQERIAGSTPIESFAAGAARVPVGLASLVDLGTQKILEQSKDARASFQLQKQRDMMQRVSEELEDVSSANPITGSMGQATANIFPLGRPGGVVSSLAKGQVGGALSGAARAAPANVAVGQGIRTLTGSETTGTDILNDAILGTLAGGKPKGKALNSPEMVANVEETFETMAGKVKDRKALQAAIDQRLSDIQEGKLPEKLPTTLEKDIQDNAIPAKVSKDADFEPSVKPPGFIESVAKRAKETVQDVGEIYSKDPAVNLRKSVRFSKNSGISDQDLTDTIVPEVYKSAAKRKIKLDGLNSGLKATQGAMDDKWELVDTRLKQAGLNGVSVPMGGFVDDIYNKVFSNESFYNELGSVKSRTAQAEAIDELMKAYGGKTFTAQQAENLLQDQNAILEAAYKKFGIRNKNLTVEGLAKIDPELASHLALAEFLRNNLNAKVSALPGEFSQFKKDWSKLRKVRDEMTGRIAVAGRLQDLGIQKIPIALQAGRGLLSGDLGAVADTVQSMAVAKALQDLESSDTYFQRAFNNYSEKIKSLKKKK